MTTITADSLFFRLLRLSMDETSPWAEDVAAAPEDWERSFAEARRQAVSGVLWRGVTQMNPASMLRNAKLTWYADAQRVQIANERNAKAAVAIAHYVESCGFCTCLLKGQASAARYPDPGLRTSGDVDLWLWPSEGWSRPERSLAFIKQQWPNARVTYCHAEIGDVGGVPVELHIRPTYRNNPLHNRRLQKWMFRQAACHGTETIAIGGNEARINVLPDMADRIYLLSHIATHVVQEGIGLRQIMDYYCLLRHGCTEDERAAAEHLLRRFGLRTMAGAVMWVLHETMALPNEKMLVPMDERRGRFLMDEIWRGGNFGQHDADVPTFERQTAVGRNWRRLRRDIRLVSLFPSEALCEPLFRTWHFFWRVCHK